MSFRKLLLLLLFAYSPVLLAQEQKVYFEDALAQHLRTFNIKTDLALKNQMSHEVDHIFDTLVRVHLRHTYISDLKLSKLSGGTLHTAQIDKPFLLITKNAAILQTKEEIKSINALANEFDGQVEIILLYWSAKQVAKKLARSYNKKVTVLYADERANDFNQALSAFKHSFGVPAGFYINQYKQISSIDRKFFLKNGHPETKELFTEKAQEGIAELLMNTSDTAHLIEAQAYR